MSEMINLNEKRYSLNTAARTIGLSDKTMYNRAKKLGIDTRRGLTAQDVKQIQAFYSKQTRKGTEFELRAELEGIK